MTHLDKLTLCDDCELRDSALPDKDVCNVDTLTWHAPVDILVMRTLLECFPFYSVKLHKCKILHRESEKITINSSPGEMVSIRLIYYFFYFNLAASLKVILFCKTSHSVLTDTIQ